MTVLLVDGSNLVRCTTWEAANADRDELSSRRRLVDAIIGWVASIEAVDEAVVVFDGAGPHGAGETSVGPVLVVGSGGRSADELIEQRAAALAAAGRPWWVVSDDREVRAVAGGKADRVLASADLAAALIVPVDERSRRARSLEPPPRGLGDRLPEDVRARLEDLRRGNR